jgi:hypothetical protein
METIAANVEDRITTENNILFTIIKLMVGCLIDVGAPDTNTKFLYNCFVELLEKDPWPVISALGKATGGELDPQWVVSLYYRFVKTGAQHSYVRIILIKFMRAFTDKSLREAKNRVEEILELELEGVPGFIN